MFRRIREAIEGVIAALNRWRDAVNKHADDLEAEAAATAKASAEANGVHSKRERAGTR